jgi:exosortase
MAEMKIEQGEDIKAMAAGKSGFLEEAKNTWQRLPNRWLFAGLLAMWLLLFQFLGNSTLGYVTTRSLFGWLRYCYNNSPDDEHGFLIPFAVAVLFWWKRKELLDVQKEPSWTAFLLVCVGLALHLVGYVVQQTRISVVGFFLGLYGLMGVVWGWRWLKVSFFPMVLFVFCVPIGTLAEMITFPLRMFVTAGSVGFSHHVLGIDVFREGSQIMDAQGRALYDVAPACSGIRSLVTLTALTTIYGFTTFDIPWKRVLMVLLALPLAVLGNLLRVTTVIIIGEAFGKDVAAAIEQKFGFVTFAFAIGCVLLLGWWLQEDRKSHVAPAVAGELS